MPVSAYDHHLHLDNAARAIIDYLSDSPSRLFGNREENTASLRRILEQHIPAPQYESFLYRWNKVPRDFNVSTDHLTRLPQLHDHQGPSGKTWLQSKPVLVSFHPLVREEVQQAVFRTMPNGSHKWKTLDNQFYNVNDVEYWRSVPEAPLRPLSRDAHRMAFASLYGMGNRYVSDGWRAEAVLGRIWGEPSAEEPLNRMRQEFESQGDLVGAALDTTLLSVNRNQVAEPEPPQS